MHWPFIRNLAILLCAGCFCPVLAGAAPRETWTAGLASIDITPDYSVRLSGYAARTSDSTGIAQRLHANALALGSREPVLLLTVDNCGVPWNVREEVLQRLKTKAGIGSERLAICSTHTHSAPLLAGYLHNLFYPPITAEQQARVSRYTGELTDALEKVALQALGNRKQATLTWARTKAGFAANRRTSGGPVDHELPALFLHSEGKLAGILATYACHCTTLTGEFNQICGDWAGFARESLEKSHPGAVVMISIGCGADANPSPRPGFDLAKQHGEEIAAAINALRPADFSPVTGGITPRAEQIFLPFDTLPSRAEWEKRANEKNHIGQQARWNLERLDRGESLPTQQPYLVQTWSFGQSLTMVFLPGEVVVDYSLRLRQELEPSKLWVHAYANDVPCYIPSERILKEGGYEGGGAMVYYDKPTRFAPGIENLIVHTVQKQLPAAFKRSPGQAPISSTP